MARLIDADALKRKITMVTKQYNPNAIMERPAILLEDVDEAPTIEAEPVRHGKWIRILDTRFGEKLNDIIGCSVCNIYYSSMDLIRRNYCPHCGAKMDEDEVGE